MKRVIIPGFGQEHFLYAGSFVMEGPSFPGFRLSLLAEMDLPCDARLPIADFSVPTQEEFMSTSAYVIEQLCTGEPVFVGCFAGRGRTGLFLAGLARLAGCENSIEWLRATYNPKSPETPEQEAFVNALPLGALSSPSARMEILHKAKSQGGRHVRFG